MCVDESLTVCILLLAGRSKYNGRAIWRSPLLQTSGRPESWGYANRKHLLLVKSTFRRTDCCCAHWLLVNDALATTSRSCLGHGTVQFETKTLQKHPIPQLRKDIPTQKKAKTIDMKESSGCDLGMDWALIGESRQRRGQIGKLPGAKCLDGPRQLMKEQGLRGIPALKCSFLKIRTEKLAPLNLASLAARKSPPPAAATPTPDDIWTLALK